MCSGSKRKVSSTMVPMEGEVREKESFEISHSSSLLLEFSATDDLEGFRHLVEEEGHDVDELGLWYGRRFRSKKMGFEERTPLMIAAMFGSKDVLNYILQKGSVDVNRASGSDGSTALHCVAAGGSRCAHEVIKLLLDSSADVNRVDAYGKRPADVISPCCNSSLKSTRKTLEIMLKKNGDGEEACLASDDVVQTEERQEQRQEASSPKAERKEYPIDPSLPDIKNGIYGTDEFRMYTFKIKPCSRAYSHDWTECPFVHPGENARRRDPRKYHYSCVPCPEFRKGLCPKGDACEYAHGIFECWLHPAQYRTRLCKDETNCTRRVCFFAHKIEELRPLYPSTGSGVASPRSYGSSIGNSYDMAPLSPLGLGSPTMLMGPSSSTTPMNPPGGSSPIGGVSAWANHLSISPPTLHLPGSPLKAALSARDMDLEAGLRRQPLLDEMAGLSLASPSSWNSPRNGSLKPTDLDDMFGTLDPSLLAQTRTLPMNHQQVRSSYTLGMPSSPVRAPSFGIEPCGSPIPNPRMSAFARRSQSFVDRGGLNPLSGGGLPSPTSSNANMPPHLSDWGSPDGKVDWGVQGDELNKLRKSASFGFQTNGNHIGGIPGSTNDPDVSWVQSLVKDGSKMIPPWVEQLYIEHEPMTA